MSRSIFNKEIRRTITHSWDRFIAIFAIVALGVGFYAGLRMTAPDMRLSADKFYDETNLMDIRVVSTLGMSEEDIEALRDIEGVDEIQAAYETDVIGEIDNEPYVIRVHSITDSLNQLTLAQGRMPEAANECVMSVDRIMNEPLKLGDKIEVTQATSELEDTFKTTTFTLVGLAHSSYYASSTSMGSSTLGGGLVQQFMYVEASDFNEDFPITEAFITVRGAKDLNSSTAEYDAVVAEVTERIDAIATDHASVRTEKVRKEAQEKLDESRAEYESERTDAYQKLDDAKTQLSDAARKIQDSEKKLDAGKRESTTGAKSLADKKAQADAGFKQAQSEIDAKRAQVAQLPVVPPEIIAQLDEAQAALDAKKAATYAQIEAGQAKLEESSAQLSSAQTKITEGWIEYEDGLAKYKENLAKADKEFADAKKKLDDAQAEIDDIKDAEWLVMDRSKNFGAESFDMDAGRVDSIAQVFPFVFFLVAALVALTTMTRMVDEERMQIGTLKALGYSRSRITSKYLIYAALASILGSIVGIFALAFTLPAIIMSAYSIVYIVPTAELAIDIPLALLASLLGICITLGATAAAAISTLRESPAALMLPPTPKAGKTILLERIRPLWSRLTFLWKVTCRNIFRYKKRLFMTVIGIAGCTALLLTGFGLQDSINDIIDKHYGQIINYNLIVSEEDGITDDEKVALRDTLQKEGEIVSSAEVLDKPFMAVGGSAKSGASLDGTDLSIQLMVPKDAQELASVWKFRERVSQNPVELGEDGAVITEKIATWFGLRVGDTLKMSPQDDMGNATSEIFELPISGITENYISHYVFVSPAEYERIFKKTPAYNTILLESQTSDDSRAQLKSSVRELTGVKTMASNDEVIDMYRNALKSVNMVVIVLIIAAALLAFIVLYNLTNINITERMREIATLKVLGFTAWEIDKYIFREILQLSILGSIVGLVLGTLLENFVVVTAEVNAVMFGRDIHVLSYVFAFLLTMLFTFIVALAMRRKVKNIDMVESLKSNE